MKAVFVVAAALLLVSSLEAASLPKVVQTAVQGVQNTLINAVATSSPAPIAVAAAAEGDNGEPKTEAGRALKANFDELLDTMKDSVEKGKELRENDLEKLKDLRQQLKDMRIDIGSNAKELIELLKEKAKDNWQKIFDKLRPEE